MKKTKAALKALREECGLSQQDIADEAGVNILAVKRWENPEYPGRIPPDDVWQFLLQARGAMYLIHIGIQHNKPSPKGG